MLDFKHFFLNPERLFRSNVKIDKTCPFCKIQPRETIVMENKKMFIIKNKYPYSPDVLSEVFVETREHNGKLHNFSEKELVEVLLFLQKRIKKIKQKNIIVFKNRGSQSAASVQHTHMQILATNKPMSLIKPKKGLVIWEGKFLKVLATPDFDYSCEIHLKKRKKFISLTKKELLETSVFLKKIFDKLYLKGASYNMLISPNNFFIKIFPRLNKIGGLELFSDVVAKNMSLEQTKLFYTDNIFKEYDIRGIYKVQIDENIAKSIAMFFSKKYKPKKVVVGNDARIGSRAIVHAVLEGFEEAGVKFDYIGDTGTEILKFATKDYDAGFMITASHNPAEYTGIKIMSKEKVYNYSNCYKFFEKMPLFSYKGKIFKKTKDFVSKYVSKIGKSNKQIILDCGNGAAGFFISKFFPRAIFLNKEPDGRFPSRDPNPLFDPLIALKKECKKRKKWGVAFDGDADRAVFIDEKGRYVFPEIIIALLSKEFSGPIVVNETASRIAKENISNLVVAKTGHTNIKEKMNQKSSFFGGEYSAHYYFRIDGMVIDSGLIPILKLTRLLKGKKLSDFYDKYANWFSAKLKIPKQPNLEQKFASYFKGGKRRKIDGLTIEYPDWWFNIRESKTEPVLKITIEAKNPSLLESKIKEIKKLL